MMKKVINIFSLLSLILIISCDNEDNTGDSSLQVTTPSISLTALPSMSSSNIVDEISEPTYTVTATLSTPQSVDVVLYMRTVGGTASEGDDYELSKITIPAFGTSGSGTIKILNDELVESEENFTIKVGENVENASFTPQTYSFIIKNYVSNELELNFRYNKNFSISGTPISLCGILYDLDFYLLDSNFDDTGNYDAAGGNCEESLVLDSSLPDGTYYIFPQLYDNGDLNGGTNTTSDGLTAFYHDPFDIPISINYKKVGGISENTMEIDESHYLESLTQPNTYNNAATPILKIIKSTVNGVAVFELVNFDTETSVAMGRMKQNSISIKRNK